MTPGSGRYPGEGDGHPLQYSCLEILWTEKPGGSQSMRLQRVRHNGETNTSAFTRHKGILESPEEERKQAVEVGKERPSQKEARNTD